MFAFGGRGCYPGVFPAGAPSRTIVRVYAFESSARGAGRDPIVHVLTCESRLARADKNRTPIV